jgi:hypothetical protein
VNIKTGSAFLALLFLWYTVPEASVALALLIIAWKPLSRHANELFIDYDVTRAKKELAVNYHATALPEIAYRARKG